MRRLDHVVLQIRAKAVLRPENRGERQPAIFGEDVRAVAEAAVHRGGIADEADPAAIHVPPLDGEQALDAGGDDGAAGRG